MVIWIIGLSGSGKTFYAKHLAKKFKKKCIFLDGDDVRKYITKNLGYSIKDRKKNSLLISNLCRFLESKGFIVICSILSIFRSHQKNNRKLFNKYIQIYLKADHSDLIKKSKKKVYNLTKQVVGKDIKFLTPYKSDLIIKNNYDKNYKKNIIKIYKLIKNAS